MTKLYLIRVNELTNDLLRKEGWRVGSFVRSKHTPYGYTFERCRLGETMPYDSREGAEWAVHDKAPRFSGVQFEVVEFRSTK